MHARPRLTIFSRQLLMDRFEQGWSAPAVAESAGVSRATVYKWLQRYGAEGSAGLAGGPRRPRGRPRRDLAKRARLGYDFVHALIDDHSRLAFSEVHRDETARTVGRFVRRALAWFAARGVRFQAVMTDNAWAYRYGRDYQVALAEIGARRVFIPPYSPQLNGKVERFNRTLLEEWAYSQPFTSNQQRHHLLEAWLHRYNYHPTPTAPKGRSPIDHAH